MRSSEFESLVAEVVAKTGGSMPEIDVCPVDGMRAAIFASDASHLRATPALLIELDYPELAFAVAYTLLRPKRSGLYKIGWWVGNLVAGTLALAGAGFFVVAMHGAVLAVVFALPAAVLSHLVYSLALLWPLAEWLERQAVRKALAATGSLTAAEAYFQALAKSDLRGESPSLRAYPSSWTPDLSRLRKVAARMAPPLRD